MTAGLSLQQAARCRGMLSYLFLAPTSAPAANQGRGDGGVVVVPGRKMQGGVTGLVPGT